MAADKGKKENTIETVSNVIRNEINSDEPNMSSINTERK